MRPTRPGIGRGQAQKRQRDGRFAAAGFADKTPDLARANCRPTVAQRADAGCRGSRKSTDSPIEANGAEPVIGSTLCLGSKASRAASASSVLPSVVTAQHAGPRRWSATRTGPDRHSRRGSGFPRWSFGGCTPRPRKEIAASTAMAAGMFMPATTIIGPMTLGRTWRRTGCGRWTGPSARSTSMKDRWRSDSIWPRAMRPNCGGEDQAIIRTSLSSPAPYRATTAKIRM